MTDPIEALKAMGVPVDAKRSPIEIPNVGRYWLAEWFHTLGFTRGAEIGVERGEYSEVLCRKIHGLTLFCVDPWLHYSDYREHVSQEKLDGFYEATKARLAPYDAHLIRQTSMEAVRDFPRDCLDFVYLDGNHALPFVVNDIYEWSRVVRPGGIVSGHDYSKTKGNLTLHVVEAVNAYTQAYQIHPWFLLGAKEQKPGELREKRRSWMWVKR